MSSTSPTVVTVPLTLRWRDMDMQGHVHQAVYHEFLDAGRSELLRRLAGEDFPWVVAHVDLDYRHEVRLETGTVDIVSWVERVGVKSLAVGHEVRHPDGTVAAAGRSVLVAWDAEARVSRPLSDRERDALQPA
jgi:acyl-CoA thioester hydrolase